MWTQAQFDLSDLLLGGKEYNLHSLYPLPLY